jgi:hypothetical protein
MSDFTIEPEVFDGRVEWWVWEHGVYEESSVLAGQYRRARVDCFESPEAAKAAYPTAAVSDLPFSHAANAQDADRFQRCLPPRDFDPSDAGESW